MWNVTIKGLLAHKLRLALTALAIVLGVTFVSGTLVLTDTLHNTFTTLFGHVYQHVDFEVRGKAAFANNNGGRSQPPFDPAVDRDDRPEGARGGLCRGHGQRPGAVRCPRRQGDHHRRCPDPRVLLRSQPAALRPEPRQRHGSDHAERCRHGCGHRAEVPVRCGRPGPHPPRRTTTDVHHLRDREVRHRQQPRRCDAGRLRPSDRATGCSTRSDATTPSTS